MKRSKKKFLALVLFAIFAIFMLPVQRISAATTTTTTTLPADPQFEKTDTTCDGLSYFCNSLDSAIEFIAGFYESVVARFLIVEPELFSSNYDGSTGHALRGAWKTFRDLANIVLFGALILIILSQITGVGISNYGIKKGLPKLLVAVIIVNTSYYICQACIDLMNILGAGIGGFFEGLLDQAAPPGVTLDMNGTWLTTLIVGISTAVIVADKALATKILIGVLLLMAICLIALLLLFTILAIRQSLCILLVIFSPLAIVCVMLPGCRKVFDFWVNCFKAVLLAYPICSILVYGSSFAGAILYSTWATSTSGGEVLKALGFLVIAITPYFFIPSTIMKGLSVMQGITQNIRSFAMKQGTNAFRGTRMMQHLTRKDQRLRDINRAGKYIDSKGNLRDRIGYRRVDESKGGDLRKRIAKAYNRANDQNRLNAAQYANAGMAAYTANMRMKNYKRRTGERFSTASDRYLNDALTSSVGVERSALGKVLGNSMNLNLKTKMNMLEQELVKPNDKESKSAKALREGRMNTMFASVLEEGEAGRDALEQYVDYLHANAASDPRVKALLEEFEAFTKGMGGGMFNQLKKKNPQLYRKIKNPDEAYDSTGRPVMNGEIEVNQLTGLSAKQFAEMDGNAQQKFVDNIVKKVEDDMGGNTIPNNEGNRAADSREVITAISLAENALNDPDIRASLSAESISRLENVVELRRQALYDCMASTAVVDDSAISTGLGSLSAADSDFDEEFAGRAAEVFTTDRVTGGIDNYTKAAKNGDTLRMEAIVQCIDKELDRRLNLAGITDPKERAVKRNEIMVDVVRRLNGGEDGKTGPFDGDSDKAIAAEKTARKAHETATKNLKDAQDALRLENSKASPDPAEVARLQGEVTAKTAAEAAAATDLQIKEDGARRVLQARDASSMFEQRFSRKIAYGR